MINTSHISSSAASAATSGSAEAPRAGASGLDSTQAPAAASGSALSGSDQVSISAAGRLVQTASTQGLTPPASDSRIAELRAAVQSGQYKVDTQQIAQGLLQSTSGLLGATGSGGNGGR